MIEPTDWCLPPLIPTYHGYSVDVHGTVCFATWRRTPEGGRWVIRDPHGKILGAGRTVASALRIARMVAGGETR